MPVFNLTSANTGNTYPVDFNTDTPGHDDVDQAVEHFDKIYAQNVKARPALDVGDTLSGAWSALSGLPTTAVASHYLNMEGGNRPDKWSESARKAVDAQHAYEQKMQAESVQRVLRGESSGGGETMRETGPSLGFSTNSMAWSLPGRAAGGFLGGLTGGGAGIETGPGAVVTAGLGATVGQAAGGMATSGVAAYRMSKAQFLYDAFRHIAQVRESKGLPFDEAAKEDAYQKLLPLAHDYGLAEAGPEAIGNAITLGAGKLIFSGAENLGKTAVGQYFNKAAKTALGRAGIKLGAGLGGFGGELSTEWITQLGQGKPQAQADAFAEGNPDWKNAVSPYAKTGGTTQALKDVAGPTIAQQALMLGMGGGIKGLAAAKNRLTRKPDELPPNQTPGTPPPTGAAPAQSPPGLAGTPGLEEHTGDLTADEVAQHFPTGTANAQTTTGSNVKTGTAMPVPPPTADAGAGAGATRTVPAFQDNPLAQRLATQGDVITDLRIPRSPQAIAESQRMEQERLTQQARLRSINAKAGRGPLIPDSPLGVYDILDFVNENRIRMPKAGEATDANYDWAETYSVPKYYRQFLGNTERGAHIDQVAQAAFDNHFIAEPTPDALMSAVQQAIQTRKQYRVELGKQQAEQQVAADRAQDFEKTQGKLRSKDQTRVAFEQLTPGDQLKIDGEDVQVADVNYDEDGYLTNVVLEDGKRFGVMQFDPQQRGGLFVDEWQPKGQALPPLMNRTAGSQITSVAAQAADVAHGRAWGPMSPSLRQSMFRAPTTPSQAPPAQAGTSGARGVAKLFSMPEGSAGTPARNAEGSAGTPARNAEADRSVRAPLAQAYQQAAQGQSTAFLPIAAVWQQAQAQNPALTPEDFVDEVMRQYNEGSVMLEGANTQQEANEAGLAIHHTPVGSAVRMVVVGAPEGSALPSLQNPASGATGAPMASDPGAAQANEPSPGGLSEAEDYRISHRPMTEEQGAARLHDLLPAFGEDIYTSNALQYFGSGDARENAIVRLLKSLRGKPNAKITIYRGGVPDNAGINPGDWITLSRQVADDYAHQNGGKVVSKIVKASDVTAWADSLLEFGYLPQSFNSTRAAGGTSPSLKSPAALAATQTANEAVLKDLGLPTAKGTRIWGGTKIKGALLKLSTDMRYPATTRFMARELAGLKLENLLLKIEADARLNWAGLYQPFTDGRGELSLNTRTLGRGELDIGVSLVHEVLHHATYQALRAPKTARQKQAKADLEALFKRAKAALAANEKLSAFDYELSNLDEFITGLFTRADFQSALADIPADAAPTLGQRFRSVLDEIFRVLAEIVTGKPVPVGSVLEASMAAALRIMQDGRTQAAHELQPLMNPAEPEMRETRSAIARPEQTQRMYKVQGNDVMMAEAAQWLDTVDNATAVQQLETGLPPAGLRKDHLPALAEQTMQRLVQTMASDKELVRLQAAALLDRAGIVWQDVINREAGRGLQQVAAASARLLSIVPILAVKRILVQRADVVMGKRFEGGAEGVTERVREVADDADAQASDALADALASELDEPADVPELGEAPLPPEPQTTPGRDARLVELEAKLKEMRERLHVADAEMQHRTTLWQKILDMLNSAKSKQSTVLTTVKAKAAAARAAAKARMAQRRSEGRLNTTPAADFADEVIIGASLIAEGIVDLANWSQAMVRELGARSKLQLDRLYTAALQQHYEDLKAEIEKTPEEPSTPRPPRTPREKITKAQRTAQSILDELSRRYADPPIFAEGQRKVNLMRELYKEHVRTPMAEAVFVQRAKQLGANEGTAGILWEAATLEINAREMMRLEKAHAKRFPLLKQNSPALHKLLNTLRAKMYPGMKWADIFAQLPATQKQRQLAIYQRLMKDDRLQGLNTAERLLLTNELDKAWQRERRKVFMRELKKAGILGEKKPVDREKVQAAAPRLLRLMNLGMLNSEMFREALAKEYGLKMIDAATAGELRALGEKIQTAPDGLPRRKLEQRLVEKLQNLAGTTFWQVMDSWWTASVLSGWRTQVDIGLGIANGIEDVGLGGIVAALRTGNKDVAVRGLANLFGRIPSAFMEAVDHVRTGNKAMMRNFELEARQAMENGNRLASDVGAQMWRTGGWRKVPGAFMIFYGRLLTALDHVNSASTREGAKALALARHPELYQRALRISDADRQAARQQARLELTAGAAPTTQQQRLEENARIREILEQSIPTEVLDDATNIGRAAALQGDPSGLGGGLLDMVNAAVGTVARKAEAMSKRENLDPKSQQVLKLLQGTAPLMRAITGTKFARTVSHALNRTLSYVPAVGVYAVGQQGRTGPFGDVLAAKQVIGTLVGLALYLSFDDDKDEKGIEDGWKDKTPQEKAQLYAAGKQPFTIWQRDAQGRVRAYNYQQWGVAGIVNTVAAMLKQKHSEAGTVNVLLSSLIQGGMSFTDKAQLQGLQTVFGDNSRSTDPASNLASRLNKWGAQTVGGVVPRLLKDIDAVASPELRTSSDWWQKWAREVPMVRELTAGKRIDILGGDILLDRSPLSRVRSIGTADPAYRLLGLLNSKDLYLPDPSQGVAVVRLADGTRRAMTTQEKDRYQRLVGKAYRQFILEQGQRLLTLDPEKAKDDIRRITDNLRRIARVQAVQR